MHIRAARARFVAVVALIVSIASAVDAGSLTGPIYDQGLTAVIEDVLQLPTTASPAAPPLARVNVLRSVPGVIGKLWVCDLNGPIYVVQGAAVQTYMDFRTLVPKFKRRSGLATGLVSFAFHPEFATNGLFYTVHTESVGTVPPNFVPAVAMPAVHHSILREWHATDPSANVFSGTSRELMRVAALNVYHNLGIIDFNPNAMPGDSDYGLLYVPGGDYGSVDSGMPTQLQRLDTIYGCIMRIDPLGGSFVRGGITYPYGIPPTNPFTSTPGALGEIYTYGHRNAHRVQWDIGHNKTMYATDIGGNNIEEIDLIVAGRNYGWPYREGTFAIDPVVDWRVALPLPPNDATFGYTYPVAQFDHDAVRFPVHGTDTQCGIAGGFPYRASAIPGLRGKFVYGDIVTGQMFYSYLDQLEAADDGDPTTTAPVYELLLQYQGQSKTLLDLVRARLNMPSLFRTDLRFAMDAAGTLYVTTKEDAMIRKITSVFVRPPLAVVEEAVALRASVVPNPMRGEAHVHLTTSRTGGLRVELFDVGGRRIRTLMAEANVPAGLHEVPVPAAGMRLPPAMYLVRIAAGEHVAWRRCVVLE